MDKFSEVILWKICAVGIQLGVKAPNGLTGEHVAATDFKKYPRGGEGSLPFRVKIPAKHAGETVYPTLTCSKKRVDKKSNALR